MPKIIPQSNEEKVVWAKNFISSLAPMAADLNFSQEEIEKIASACETVIFSVQLARAAKLYSKVCHSWRRGKLTGEGVGKGDAGNVPLFSMPDVPENLFEKDALGYLQKVIALIKVQPNYDAGLGTVLGIVPSKSAPPSLTDAQPKVKIRSLGNSVVRIDWTKGKFDGVIVYCKRGDETEFTEIGRDNYSPFIDTRPPLEVGKPELRTYRLRYLFDDQPAGQYSNNFEISTNP